MNEQKQAAGALGSTEGLGAASEARWRYYYRVIACAANHASDASCICWHDEGTGPRSEERHADNTSRVHWRRAHNVGIEPPRSGRLE
jgi:hypothetical protein